MGKPENSDMGFILFSPECTTTRLYLDALGWLSERRVVFCGFAWRKLSQADVAYLYASNRQNRNYGPLDELVDRLFSLDYSLAARVRIPGISNVHEYLTRLKGPSDPAMATPRHLRRWLGATNKILNFVHTSDTAAAASEESRLFFEECREFPPSTRVVPPEPPSLQRIPPVSGFLLRCKLKRLATSLPSAVVSDRFRDHVQAEWELLASVRDHLSLASSLKELLRVQLCELEIGPGRGLVSTEVLRLLCVESVAPGTSSISHTHLASLLRQVGIYPSSWEDLILACESCSAS